MDRRLASEVGHIKVDYVDQGVYGGFRISPAQEPVSVGSGAACSCA